MRPSAGNQQRQIWEALEKLRQAIERLAGGTRLLHSGNAVSHCSPESGLVAEVEVASSAAPTT
jgi:hypothetical protein